MKTLIILFALAASAADPEPWSVSQVITPAEFAPVVTKKDHPRILYVGFPVLYRSKHIPDAELAGPGSKPEGLDLLKKAVEGVPKDQPIVIYCGCCPFGRCPNMRPAFKQLQAMGFTRVKVLSIPTNFTKDWLDPGYPFEPGSAAK